MKTVNRGYILVEPRQAFCDWAKLQDEDFDFDEEDDLEGSVYLIEEDFFEVEPVLEKNFKRIMLNECEAVTDDDSSWPKPTMDLFLEWFRVRVGGSVFDAEENGLSAE